MRQDFYEMAVKIVGKAVADEMAFNQNEGHKGAVEDCEDTLSQWVLGAFDWMSSPQGVEFWDEIYYKVWKVE